MTVLLIHVCVCVCADPLFTVACQFVLQVFGFELQFGSLLDLLLPLGTQLLLLLLHRRDTSLQLPHDSLCLLQT